MTAAESAAILQFPDKFYLAASYLDKHFSPLETAPGLTDPQRLGFYALRKQIEKGACTESAPYMWNFRERYMHDAWKSLGNMSSIEAMVHFVNLLEEIKPTWLVECLKEQHHPPAAATVAAPRSSSSNPLTNDAGGDDHLKVSQMTSSKNANSLRISESSDDDDVTSLHQPSVREKRPRVSKTPIEGSRPRDGSDLSHACTPENVERLIAEIVELRIEVDRFRRVATAEAAAHHNMMAPIPMGPSPNAFAAPLRPEEALASSQHSLAADHPAHAGRFVASGTTTATAILPNAVYYGDTASQQSTRSWWAWFLQRNVDAVAAQPSETI